MAAGGLLAELEEAKGSVDLGSVSVADLTDLSRRITKGQRLLTGFATDVTREMQARSDSGSGPEPEDVLGGERPGNGGRPDRPDRPSRAEARRLTRRARALTELPALAAAVSAGEVMTEIIDLVVHTLGELSGDRRRAFVATDETVTSMAKRRGLDGFRRWLRSHLDRLDKQAGLEIAARQRAASSLTMGSRVDGMGWFNAQADPQRAEEMRRRIRALAHQLADTRDQPMSDQLQFEALYLLITQANGGAHPPRPIVAVLTDAANTAGETWGGHPVTPEAVERACCDADLWHVLIGDTGLPLAVARRARHATPAQRLALRVLYPLCPLSGEPFDRCQIHHVTWWEDGGFTDLDNLLPVSTEWHHRLHEGGWTIKMAVDRSLKVYRPDGTLARIVVPPTPITRRPRDGP
ncbi:MAG: DUF222 domain-containing protein [Actinomycetia bacterium]|nr:DUF222 domain-containing protein [Actinomycetes bacterium]